MIKKTIALFLVATLSYLFALIVYMPVSFAWQNVQNWLPRNELPMRIQQTNGTLWLGEALLQSRFLSGVLSWDLDPLNFINNDSLIKLNFRSDKVSLETHGRLSSSDLISVEGELKMDLAAINPMLKQHRLDLSGVLNVRQLEALIDSGNGQPREIHGQAKWDGGTVSYPLGRQVQTTVMPPLIGRFAQAGENITLDVSEEASGLLVMQAQLTPEGVVNIQIRKRLLDLAGAPWSGSSEPDDIVFKIQQKVI